MSTATDIHRQLLDNLYDGVYLVDQERRITYWNRSAERITGYHADDVVGCYCYDKATCYKDHDGHVLCDKCPLLESLSKDLTVESRIMLKSKDSRWVPVIVRFMPLKDEENGIAGAAEIDPRGLLMQKKIDVLTNNAQIDFLTGLPNRRNMEDELHKNISKFQRYGWRFGVVFADIDNFKSINDEYGHHTGDQTLKSVSLNLASGMRDFDILSRWGGDEFVSILVNIPSNELYGIAERVRCCVQDNPISAEANVIVATVSIGATLCRKDDTVDSVLERADKLMYHSKVHGKNRVTTDVDVKVY